MTDIDDVWALLKQETTNRKRLGKAQAMEVDKENSFFDVDGIEMVRVTLDDALEYKLLWTPS